MGIATAIAMTDFSQMLANPIVAFLLRLALGAYIVFMARGFYADPLGYFRRWMPNLPDQEWMRLSVRYAAVFCVWGGCFIVATAVATQILDLHGTVWAFALMALAACAAYFLLPGDPGSLTTGSPEDDSARGK